MTIVNNDNVESLYDWDSIDDDLEGIKLYSLMDRANTAAKSGLAGWLWKMAKDEFDAVNNPIARKQTVYDNFTKRVEDACAWVVSEAAGQYRMAVGRCKLTGSNGIAGAYKKISQAILNGGDLNELRSASACQSFNTQFNKDKAEEDTAKRRREEAKLDAEEAGFKPGTEEFDAEVERLIEEMIKKATTQAANEGEGHSPDPKFVGDAFDLMGKEIAGVLRELEAAKEKEFAKNTGNDKGADVAALNQVKVQVDAFLNKITKMAADTMAKIGETSGFVEGDDKVA
jgi:hypothetical protein